MRAEAGQWACPALEGAEAERLGVRAEWGARGPLWAAGGADGVTLPLTVVLSPATGGGRPRAHTGEVCRTPTVMCNKCGGAQAREAAVLRAS